MSIVFEARKLADQAKRARKAKTENQTPGSGPLAGAPANTGAHESGHPPAPGAEQLASPVPALPPPTLEAAPAAAVQKPAPEQTIAEPSAPPPAPSLDLGAEWRTTYWRIGWNPAAASNAVRGRLTISDGNIQKPLNLTVSELRTGSGIIYKPATTEVSLLLEIDTPAGPVSEAVRLVVDAPAPPVRRDAPHAAPANDPAAPVDDKNDARNARSDGAWAPAAAGSSRLSGQGPIVGSLLRTPRFSPSSEAQAAAALDQLTDEQRGAIEPATLIARKDPEYPAIARQCLITGSVEVHFNISPEGKVYNARSVKGSPILARAAIQAVEAWCYEPARLNGNPIESQGSTGFDFQLS